MGEDEASLAAVVKAADAVAGMPRWIVLAVIHAFWRKANVAPQVTSSVLNAWPEIPASIEEVLSFKAGAAAEESDPFLFFHPIATETIPIPALDEYMDLVQNRFFIWKRPTIDRTSLGRALIEGSQSYGGGQYLDALRSLKAQPSYQSIWLGFTEGGRFFRNERSRHNLRPTLASSVSEISNPSSSFENSYACKISINVSIAARELKRRALGLDVVS
ncbi:hypothetical protein [Rhizobium sp. Root149]|uniref:hypothetical protein n=1 Tax=Rhizobium sp. Root149 TaxID=1736473 RepID=UPI001FCE2876|nr:hypothetical protein [Rhizobium sp. Root149]